MKEKNHIHFSSALHFSTPIWIAEVKNFLDNTIQVTDEYIKNADKILKNKLKDEPDWKKKLGDFGLSKHSESFSNDKRISELVQFIGARSFDFLKWQGFDLKNHSLHFTEFWVQEFSKRGGGHHDTHIHWNQHISGFYFLKCSEKTSYPVFHDPRPSAEMTKLPFINQKDITLGSNQIHYRPKVGTMMIFPSYLPHQFVLDAGIEPFRFIHWNIKVVESSISKERSIR